MRSEDWKGDACTTVGCKRWHSRWNSGSLMCLFIWSIALRYSLLFWSSSRPAHKSPLSKQWAPCSDLHRDAVSLSPARSGKTPPNPNPQTLFHALPPSPTHTPARSPNQFLRRVISQGECTGTSSYIFHSWHSFYQIMYLMKASLSYDLPKNVLSQFPTRR